MLISSKIEVWVIKQMVFIKTIDMGSLKIHVHFFFHTVTYLENLLNSTIRVHIAYKRKCDDS